MAVKRCAVSAKAQGKKGVRNMQPQPEAICDLFIPFLITFGLLAVVVLQYAFGNDIEF